MALSKIIIVIMVIMLVILMNLARRLRRLHDDLTTARKEINKCSSTVIDAHRRAMNGWKTAEKRPLPRVYDLGDVISFDDITVRSSME